MNQEEGARYQRILEQLYSLEEIGPKGFGFGFYDVQGDLLYLQGKICEEVAERLQNEL